MRRNVVDAFRVVIESGDFATLGGLFTDDVVLHSPIAHRPYRGPDTVAGIITVVAQVFENFRYQQEFSGLPTGSGNHALVFTATVGGLHIQGCDFLHSPPDDLIDEITVMLRPLKAVTVFAEKMAAHLESAGGRGR